ncbi:Rpn family recombination-promoting nuclease/putative transposase [Pendulispora albinea]|uniref:Rpn family recombination-promoting nuclease/putative transposase n=1 Tax=Pendulispora albinea TaxID=2741071 RepID=A0ABZ2M3M0_9BACT
MSAVMRPLFADPRTDYAFKAIFGTEEHKPLLVALLNDLLELDEAHRVVQVELLSAEQRPKVSELKHSIVDVKCRDARGTTYVVEMQVLNVEGFEKRVVYNVAKAYTSQLGIGEHYPTLNDVIGVTICDFNLWPEAEVPLLSRWRMQEQHTRRVGLPELQFVFLELPKLDRTREPQTVIEKWAYFFREASKLKSVPPVLAQKPHLDALDAARTARFSEEEWEAYIRAGMAIQDERGALSLARREGREEGHKEGHKEGHTEGQLIQARTTLRRVLRARGLAISAEDEARIDACSDLATLDQWLDRSLTADTVAAALTSA